MAKTSIKKISEKEYEVTEVKESSEVKVINFPNLQDDITQLKEKMAKIESEILAKEDLLDKLKKAK